MAECPPSAGKSCFPAFAAPLLFSILLASAAEPLPVVRIDTAAVDVMENSVAPVPVKLSRSGPAVDELRVDLQLSGTARFDRDYRLSTQVIFAPGETNATLEFSPIDNALVEPDKTLTITAQPALAPFSIVLLPDTQYYTGIEYGGVPSMFSAQTQWAVDHQQEWNIRFLLHEGDCTDLNTPIEWQRTRASMTQLDGLIPYAIAAGNHDGLMTGHSDTALFNEYFPLAAYSSLQSFGGAFESNRMDNVYHTFRAGGLDWLVLALEFGPRDEVLDWANAVVTNNPARKVIIVTHAHVYLDNTLHGSSPDHFWAPRSYGRENDGIDVWNKLVRRHENIAFVFNGHVLGNGQGRVVGVGDHGNRVFQMLCNYQTAPNGGSGYMRVIQFFPGEDRLEAHSFSPYTGRNLLDPLNEFAYTNLGVFAGLLNSYAVDGAASSVTVRIVNDDIDLLPAAIVTVSASGMPGVIAASFDELLERSSAEDIANYSIPGVSLESATLMPDGMTVILRPLTALQANASYSLVVNGVADVAPARNVAVDAISAPFTYLPLFMSDDFSGTNLAHWAVVDQGTLGGPSRWTLQGGMLMQLNRIYGPDSAAASNRLGTCLVWDAPEAPAWSNYTMVAALTSFDAGGIGMVFRYANPSNYYKFEMDMLKKFRRLTRLVDGVESVLAEDTRNGSVYATRYLVRIEAGDGQIRVLINDKPAFPPVPDTDPTAGTVGLYAWGNAQAVFDDVAVLPIYRRPLVTISAPAPDQTFYRGTNIIVDLGIEDPDGWLDRIELLDRGDVIATLSPPATSIVLSNVAARDYLVTAHAIDKFQQEVISAPVRWHVIAVPPPFFVIQPRSRLVAEDSNVMLYGHAISLFGVRYQWNLNGVPLPGATNAILFINGVRTADAGDYTLSAINPGGTTISAVAAVSIFGRPSVSVIGADTLVLAPETFLDDGRAVYSVTSPLGVPVQVECSQDLQHWRLLATVTNTSDRAYFIDDVAHPQQFYRATMR